MEAWTSDSYDVRDSYEELQLRVNQRHWQEPPLEPKLFHRMRATMALIEGEMHETLEEVNTMFANTRMSEWQNLKKVALSICDDYTPDASMGNQTEDDPHMLGSECGSEEGIGQVHPKDPRRERERERQHDTLVASSKDKGNSEVVARTSMVRMSLMMVNQNRWSATWLDRVGKGHLSQ